MDTQPTADNPTHTGIFDWTAPFTIECDIIETTSTNDIQIYDNTTNINKSFNQMGITGNNHLKIVVGVDSINYFVDGVNTLTISATMGSCRVGFRTATNRGGTIKYKNFVIYENINGVTDGKGEFALYDVSVTDDTTFTASYGTETATTNVYLCQFVDYGITSNSNLIQWFYSPSYSSASVDESGTTFTAVREGSYATVSATLTQNPTSTDIYPYSFPLTVEFDLIGWEDNQGATSDYARIRVYNQANNKIAYWNVRDYGVGHYKIVCSNGSQKLYFNGVEQSRKFTFTPTTQWNVAFQTKGNIKFKNFRIRAL